MNTLQTKLLWLLTSALCAGCTSQAPLVVPKSGPTMIEIYQRHALQTTPSGLNQVKVVETVDEVYGPKAESTSKSNPVVHVYVFPHISGTDGLKVPGYWTSFRLEEWDTLEALRDAE